MKLSVAARREENWGWIMVAPTIIGLLVLNLWPFVQTLYTSFCEHLGFGHYKFIGLQNYIEMFQNAEFWKATWNTIYFCILTVPLGLFLSLLVAMLLNAKVKGKGVFRTIFFLPMVCAPAAVTMVWRWIFNSEYGILNQMLGTHVNWITDSKVVMIACAIVAIWSNIGYDAVLLLAGLQNISKSYYEAANIDGATKVTQFFQITLPLIWTNIRTTLTFFIISTINMAFLFVKAMVAKGMADVGLSFMYAQKDAGLYGYSMAAGVVIFLFSFLLSAMVNKVTKRDVLEM